jgi:hypothetical protein
MNAQPVCVAILAALATGVAWAGSQIESRVSSCSATNCAGETIRATHQASEPFVTQIFARAGECLRLDVTQQSADVAILVGAPTPPFGVSSDDRDGATDTRPLLMLDALPWTGWYTVIVGYEDVGNAVVRFRLDYGRYPGGNANCAAPAAAAAQKFVRLVGDPEKIVAPAVDAELEESAE